MALQRRTDRNSHEVISGPGSRPSASGDRPGRWSGLEMLEQRLLLAGDITVAVDLLSTADTTPELTGTVSDTVATVRVNVNGENYDAANNGDGTWTLADDTIDPPLVNGTYDVLALAENEGAGTFGVDETTDELVVETVDPIVTVDELVTNLLRPALTGTINDPQATIEVTVNAVDYTAVNNGDGTWTLPANVIAILAEATYDVTVTATDPDEDVGTDDTTDELIIDRTAPVVTVDALTTNEASPELTGTIVEAVDDEAQIVVTVDGGNYDATNNGDGTWTLDAGAIDDLSDGLYDVTVTGTDEAGNVGTDDTLNELTVELPPIVTINKLATSDTTPPLTGTVSEPTATINVNVDGADYAAVNNGNGTWTLADDTVAVLAEGTYDVVVTATIAGPLVGTDDTLYELEIDITDPVVTVDDLETEDTTPDLTGTIDEADSDIVVTVHGRDYDAVNNGDGTWTLPGGALVALSPGTYDVSVTATDSAENEGTDATTDELDVLPTVTVNELATKDTTPALTGTINSPTATISINVDGADYAAVNNGNGTWTLADDTVAVLAEGTYEVVATATVGALVNTDSTINELTVDTTAPVVTVHAMDPTTDTTPEITGTVSESDAEITVRVGGQDYDAVNNGNGTWTLADDTVAPLAKGTYTVNVTATDPAGNEGTASGSLEITVAPVVTVNPLATTDTTPELTGTVSDPAATINVNVDGADYAAVNNGDGTWTLADDTVAALADGTYDVIVTATIPVDIEGTDDTQFELMIDTVAPVVTVDDLETEDTTPTVTGTISEPGAEIVVTLHGREYDATNFGDGTWALAGSEVVALAPGTYDVSVTATDEADNEGTDATSDELDILPTVTVDVLATTDTTPELTGTVNSATATISINVDGADYAAVNNGNGTWTLPDNTVAALAEGTYEVVATATLGALVNTDGTADELTVDATAPVVTIDPMDPTTDTTPEITGTVGEPDAAISVNVAAADYDAVNNGDGTWTLADGTVAALAEGTYTVTVTATDPAGNEATASDSLEITVAPVVTVDELATTDTTPELTGTVSDPAATISVNVDGADYAAVNNGDGTWTLADNTVAVLADGTYDVAVTATVGADVEGTDDTVNELAIDTAPPVVGVDELETEDATPTIWGTINEPEAEIVVTLNGREYDATNFGDGTWAVAGSELVVLTPGTYDVSATATDPAGNEGSDTTTDELDILPAVTVDVLATTDTTPELTGTINDAGATISVNVNGADYAAVNNGNGTWTLPDNTVAALAEGAYEVVATATVGALTNTDSTVNELTVDTTAPVVTLDDLEPTDEDQPEITGTVSDPDAEVTVEVVGRTYDAVNNGDGTWTLAQGSIFPLAEGTHPVTATATDAAGNEDTATGSIEIQLPPVVTVDSLITNDPTPELTGTVDDIDATVVVTIEGADYAAVVEEDDGQIIWTLADDTVAALPEGTYDVIVTATDTEANDGTDETVNELVIDLTPPAGVTIDEIVTGDTTSGLTGTVSEPDAEITVTINGRDYDATNNGDGTWTLPDNAVDNLPAGIYDAIVTAADAAGNETTDTTTDEVTITGIAPTVTVNFLSTSNKSPRLTGTVDDPDAEVSVIVNNQIYGATNNGDGTWTLEEDTIIPLPVGTYDVDIFAVNETGNAGFDQTNLELTILPETTVMLNNYLRTLRYVEPDGTLVHIRQPYSRFTGTITLTFSSDSVIADTTNRQYKSTLEANAGITLNSIEIAGDTSKLIISARGGADKAAQIGQITGTANIKSFKAKRCDLVDGINLNGLIESIYVRNILGDVIMTGAPQRGMAKYGVKIVVSQKIEDATIELRNVSVRTLIAGAMINSSLLCGALTNTDDNGDNVIDLPQLVDLAPGFSIKVVKIKGYRGAEGDLFVNSNIACDYIGKVLIRNARLANFPDTDGDDEPDEDNELFGVTANTLRVLKLKQGRSRYTWKYGAWTAGFDPIDLTIRAP